MFWIKSIKVSWTHLVDWNFPCIHIINLLYILFYRMESFDGVGGMLKECTFLFFTDLYQKKNMLVWRMPTDFKLKVIKFSSMNGVCMCMCMCMFVLKTMSNKKKCMGEK